MSLTVPCATETEFEQLLDEVNEELAAGNWGQVRLLVRALYAYAVLCGDELLAGLLEDLHWIASDALAFPVLGAGECEEHGVS